MGKTPVTGDHSLCRLGGIGSLDELKLLWLLTGMGWDHVDCRDDGMHIVVFQDLGNGRDVCIVDGENSNADFSLQLWSGL